MSSYLDLEGVYDPKKMYAVTNWTDEIFSISWKEDNGDETVHTLQPGDVKVYPQYLAFYITRHLVDREMFKIAEKENEERARERLSMAASNKDQRKPFEDKTIQEVIEGQESPEVAAMRAKIRKEIEAEQGLSSEMHQQAKVAEEVKTGVSTVEEFADLPKPE